MAEWKPEEHLQNADLNLNQYGDDSTPANQISTPWWENTKYTGEWTLNSNIAYNKNLKTTDLDPEYKYGWDAQLANSAEAWYIARRNDNIASALYNEWRRSKEDVIQFLGSQKNWNNSTEADRFNTVESVWKRIWDIQEQEDKDNTEIEVKEMEAEKKEEPKGKNVDVNTFLQWSTTELFGKMITWADTAPYDHNSNEWKKAEVRLAQYQNINSLTVPQLASSIKSWSILSGWQAMKDLQTYNPEKYQQLQEYQKKEEALDQINMISSGDFKDSATNLQEKTWESINNYLNETVANAWWNTLSRMDLDTALSQNQGLVNYAERMSYYQAQINQLDQTIWNLAEEARARLSKATGENVPEYMIQKYINNRSKKLYNQRNNLKNQYDYYKWVYEAQVEQEAKKWERDYKERQLALQESKSLWDQAMDQANLDYKNKQLKYNYDKMNNDNIRKTYWEINSYAESWMKGKGLKNNNPWNIKDTTFGASLWTDANWFAIFETPEDWFDALVEKIKFNQTNPNSKYYWKTIAEYFKLYAPDSDGNNSTAYANSVAKQLWVNVNTPISKLDPTKFASVIAKHDSGYDYSTYGNFRGKVSTSKSTTSKKEEKVYTNDENLTRLMQWKISYSDFVKDWKWDGYADEIEDYVWTNYFQKKPLMFMSNLKDSVDALAKIFNQWGSTKEERETSEADAIQKAEMYTLEHLANNDKISNEAIMKQVKKYLDEVWNADDEIVTYLSYALAWRYKDKKTLDKDLDVIGYKDSIWKKDRANAIWKIWKEDWIVK